MAIYTQEQIDNAVDVIVREIKKTSKGAEPPPAVIDAAALMTKALFGAFASLAAIYQT